MNATKEKLTLFAFLLPLSLSLLHHCIRWVMDGHHNVVSGRPGAPDGELPLQCVRV